MEYLFTTVPGMIMTIGGILVVAVVGLLYFLGLFKKGKDTADDRLINILKDTVDELEKKVNKQTVDIENLTREVHEFKKENEILTKILQGKDEETKEYFKRGYASMDTVQQSHDILTTMAKSIQDTNIALTKLIDLLDKHLEVIGKVATTP